MTGYRLSSLRGAWRRSNPQAALDCFTTLAMTIRVRAHSACRRTVRSIPLSRNRRVGRRFDARDPIEICDQSREQGNKLRGLLVREAAQRLAITPEQGCNRLADALLRLASVVTRLLRPSAGSGVRWISPSRSMRASICAIGGCSILAKRARSRCVLARPSRSATSTGR